MIHLAKSMDIIKSGSRELSRYFDFVYAIKFIVLLTIFYYSNMFFVGLTIPGGLYSHAFTYDYNYFNWIIATILHTSNLIAQGFGLDAYVGEAQTLRVVNGSGVHMGWQCVGLGVLSFWSAFIMAQDSSWKKRIYWCLGGIIGIWLINCFRVAFLLLAVVRNWEVNNFMDHHDMFNLVAYTLIIFLIYIYYRQSKKESNAVEG